MFCIGAVGSQCSNWHCGSQYPNWQTEWVGIFRSSLQWFFSYLSDRSFSVAVGNFSSSSKNLFCRVPQGSVLGPILFALYMLPLGKIIRHFNGIAYHCYADDIQLYISFKPQNMAKLSVLNNCLESIKNWMSDNFLQLNANKTKVLISAPPSLVSKMMDGLESLTSSVKSSIRNLGVTADQALTLDQHVKCHACVFSTERHCKTQVHSVSRWDGNIYSCFYLVPSCLLQLLLHLPQQNITGSSRGGPKCCF